MKELVPEFKHIYSLTPEWRQGFIDYFGGEIIDEKMYLSEEISSGASCFLEILPDVSVLLIDTILNTPIRFTRFPSEDDFWIVYYDLSDSYSKHIVEGVNHKIGYKSKLNFGIVDNQIRSSYLAEVGDRFYSLRLFIRKSYIKTFCGDAEFEQDFKDVFDDKKMKMFFYGHIDSRSKVVLHSLKQKSINSATYEFILKGAAFTLLGYLIERLNSRMPNMGAHLEKDIEAVMASQQYLLSNLLVSFPGMKSLASSANMSSTKYRILYNDIFGMTPALFFKNEKLLLAKELLESGDFELVSDVSFELGYNKTSYFSSLYKDHFGVLPSTVLK